VTREANPASSNEANAFYLHLLEVGKMGQENADVADENTTVLTDDILRTAWFIAAKHLTAGQKDVTKMIAEGMLQERLRCFELVKAALGPDADRAIFISHPEAAW
jgi:hypothetical protein